MHTFSQRQRLNYLLVIIFILPQAPVPLLFLYGVRVEERRQEGVAVGMEGHVVAVSYVQLQVLCCMNHIMMKTKGIHSCHSPLCALLEFTLVDRC